MFTGLVADVGTVERIETTGSGARLRIATELAGEIASGDSVAVNGACLTVAEVDGAGFEADAMNQTLALTSLGGLVGGDPVNLELALRASDRLGGHIVQGHVDGTGAVAAIEDDGIARRLQIACETSLLRQVVERGSVAIDGVSLTVVAVSDEGFEVSLIPETLERTTLGRAEPGRRVNVETDVLAKYVDRMTGAVR